jgi:hypothetical protein
MIRYIFIAFILGLGHSLYGQDELTSPLELGFRIGAVVSEFSDSQPHTSQRLGFTAGAIVTYNLSEKFSVQVEPAYLQQGGSFVRFSDDTRFGDNTGTISPVYTTSNYITMHNLDVPVMAKLNLMDLGGFVPHIMLGPSFSYNFSTSNSFERTYYYNQTFKTVTGKEDVSSDFERISYGATAGIGGTFSMGSKKLFIDIKYKYGITPVKKSYSYIDLQAVKGDLLSNSYYFTIGLGF